MFHVYHMQFKRSSERGVRASIQELRLKAEILVDRLNREPDCASTFTWTDWAALFEVAFSRDPDRSDFRRLPDASIVAVLTAVRCYAHSADIGRSYFISLWREAIMSLWTNGTSDIAAAAEACLPVINTRLQREKDRKTLLRPGEQGDEGGELLRAASGPSGEEGEEMLRPSSPA